MVLAMRVVVEFKKNRYFYNSWPASVLRRWYQGEATRWTTPEPPISGPNLMGFGGATEWLPH